MKITLTDTAPKPVATEKTITVNGREVGTVKPTETMYSGNRWHACFALEVGMCQRYLVQGFGTTPESAVMNAVADGRRDIEAINARMNWLECELGTVGMSEQELRQSFEVSEKAHVLSQPDRFETH